MERSARISRKSVAVFTWKPPFRAGVDGAFAMRPVDIADGDGLHFRHLHGDAQIAGAHGSDADESEGNAVVGSLHAPGEEGSGESRAGRGEKVAAEHRLIRTHSMMIVECGGDVG